MKTIKLCVVLAASILLSASAARAQYPCAQDVATFCGGVAQAHGDVGACMNQHYSELSPECRASGSGTQGNTNQQPPQQGDPGQQGTAQPQQ